LPIFFWGCGRISDEQLAALRNPNPIVRETVIGKIAKSPSFLERAGQRFFGRKNDETAVLLLTDMLREDTEPVKNQILINRALGELGKIHDVPINALLQQLDHKNEKVRNEAVVSLGKTKSKKATAPLLKLLARKDVGSYAVIWALGEIRDVKAVSALENLLLSKDPYLRYHARFALAKIGSGNGVDSVGDIARMNGKAHETSGSGVSMQMHKLYQDVMKTFFDRISGKA
jgi:HEAT repeat protein